MFTGLVESTGVISSFDRNDTGATLEVDIPFIDEISMGESIAINGCCLTVSNMSSKSASFNLLNETLDVTAMNSVIGGIIGYRERAIAAGQRCGWHVVTGHVDVISQGINYSKEGDDHRLDILFPSNKVHLLVHKGSIAIDGISLTIADINDENQSLTCWITPHTHSNTNLFEYSKGDSINLECDLIAKHLERLVTAKE